MFKVHLTRFFYREFIFCGILHTYMLKCVFDKMNGLQQFHNCKLLRNGKLIYDNLWVLNGVIVDPEKLFYDEKVKAENVIDCQNAIISPGYIDLQINGGFGVDFSHNIDHVEDGINKVAKNLLAHGVTSFCPTLVTSSNETYHKILPKIKKSPGGKHGATVLGVHVEGPFISPTKKGAHQEIFIKQFNNGFQTVIDAYGDLENISYVTLAPEIDNSFEVIRELCDRNIKVSVGLVLVTDAISALGLQEGLHRLGQLDIEIKSGQAYIAKTDTLCGSIAAMSECVKFFKKATGCSIVEALEAATLHPARALGVQSHKGILNFKADADFLLLNDNLDVLSTWIAGECVYQNQTANISGSA
ncbi:N-acetylglucosamine-6-phosphate deacetylase isoform X4 [Microplitis mediator]|uniref:N-acetylglucosamine-6-phosphate deacetylase isoform X4 n=1 Tax=Microplitis mediator TaxID=375433 RepID=UPI002556E6A2|nr:N-acetylglucosamine-6-phosphate deacetylase isoform X4 [Microplitis mediator]